MQRDTDTHSLSTATEDSTEEAGPGLGAGEQLLRPLLPLPAVVVHLLRPLLLLARVVSTAGVGLAMEEGEVMDTGEDTTLSATTDMVRPTADMVRTTTDMVRTTDPTVEELLQLLPAPLLRDFREAILERERCFRVLIYRNPDHVTIIIDSEYHAVVSTESTSLSSSSFACWSHPRLYD